MSKLQKQAKELLQSAAKIYHYRRDVTPEGRLQELEKAVEEVDSLIKSGDDSSHLKGANIRLHGILGKIGGKMYPKGFLNDNIEVALVAAILVIGVRTFFFQPFIIPTNSMYPTYNGMTSSVYEQGEESPSTVKKLLRLAAFGARHRTLTASASGDVNLMFVNSENSNHALKSRVRTFGPFTADQYLFSIGGVIHELNVPKEFDLISLLKETFEIDQFETVKAANSQNIVGLKITDNVVAGEDILKFDVLLGDALFVDRLSYHFIRPDAGDPFVFRTDPILKAVGDATGDYTPKYYIKRIGGVGGETLEIKDSTLLADGQPRNEVEAYARNAIQEGEYSGYINHGLLATGRELTIPDDSYVALGDNSANSADSRYWGFVPEKAVIGRAIFIYYPFTKRWGVAE